MVIAIAGGKGGAGKTTVAVNLAVAFGARGRAVQLLDCDVEEPNCHLFLKPNIERRTAVTVLTPRVDRDKCDLCGTCARVCAFGAIACLKNDVVVFPELCHACGGCALLCPKEAIVEQPREVGTIAEGCAGSIRFAGGTLRVGEPRATPVIAALRQRIDRGRVVVLDVPPGTSCPVVESVKDVDLVVLVAEPTPFGLNDLTLIVEAMSELGLPMGVVVNRVGIGDDRVQEFAGQRGIPVLAEIPDSRQVAVQQARGRVVFHAVPELAAVLQTLAATLEEQVQTCRS